MNLTNLHAMYISQVKVINEFTCGCFNYHSKLLWLLTPAILPYIEGVKTMMLSLLVCNSKV